MNNSKPVSQSPAAKYVKLVPWLIVAVALPFIAGSEYIMSLACLGMIYFIAVSGLDVLFGYSGQISMGHAAYYAIGAYGTVLLHTYWKIPILVAMVIAAILAGVIGMFIAIPASKLVFHFLNLAMVAFGEIVYQFVLHSPGDITGNARGIFLESLSIGGLRLDTYRKYYWFALLCVIFFLICKNHLTSGNLGRSMQAVRENTLAAAGMGINVRRCKVTAFVISTVFTAFAGGMYVSSVGYISPDTFTQKQSVLFLTMLVFGGTASLPGPLVGVVLLMFLTELLRPLAQYQVLIYGIILLLVIIAIPGGVYSAFLKLVDSIRRRFQRNTPQSSQSNS